jgi:CDP-diacylglycerol--glycerol-3-phosphate 3-phosphatidyltransferase/cardiolipin synthase
MPRRVSWADALTVIRVPLAVGFVVFPSLGARLAILVLAAVSDFSDGWVARRYGASRIGAVLDPVADKLFAAAAFGVVLWSGRLAWYEVVALLARDIVATVAVLVVVLIGRPTAVPARAGGKAVTLLQFITLLAFLLESPLLRPLAWATAAVALYALWDYNRLFFSRTATP